ncbi:MAG: transposase [Rhodothermaceae bacterium]|nr:MAG: transposase [Rhodothermaceae bacterium]
MPYAPLPQIHEELEELQQRLRAERHAERKRRLHLLVLLKSKTVGTRKEAAAHLAVHRNTIRQWLNRYKEGGLEGLLEIKKRGFAPGQRTVPDPVCAALQARLARPEGVSGYAEIQRWLVEEFGLEVPYKSVYNLVRYHLGAKLKVPRPEHPKKA